MSQQVPMSFIPSAMTEWLAESWSYIPPWAGFLGAGIVAVRSTYAAQRDREALSRAELEREKLALEIARLRNSPESVADRRGIYERLRTVLSAIVREAAVNLDQIGVLHEVRHDSAFRFPTEISESIRGAIGAAVALHVSNKALERGPYLVSDEQWSKIVADNDTALRTIHAFQNELEGRFRSYLSM